MAIIFENVSFRYHRGLPWEKEALCDISMSVAPGEILGIVGATGSGKSTLLQLMNGILLPTAGDVKVDGSSTSRMKGKKLAVLRQKVGLVLQFPEDQIFEIRVSEDIAFGPRNLGCRVSELTDRVRDAMEAVGLPYEVFKDRAPYTLSGGEKRRVAIAGILAMRPDYLVLDEPAAGLDAAGSRRLLEMLIRLSREQELGIVLVSHRLQDVLATCTRVIVMNEGRIAAEGEPRSLLTDAALLNGVGLDVPPVNQLLTRLKSDFPDLGADALNIEEAARMIAEEVRQV